MQTQTERLYQKLVKKETGEWRKKKDMPDSWWSIVHFGSIILFVVCLFAFLFLFLPVFLSTPWSSVYVYFFFSMLAVTALMTPIFFFSRKKWHQEADKAFPIPSETILPSRLIPSYLLGRLTSLKKDLIGVGSRFHKALADVRNIKQRAMANAESIRVRLAKRPDAAHLQALVAPNQEVIRRASQIEAQLFEFQAKVEAYLAECQVAISQVEEPLVDLELVRSTNELASQIVVVEQEAWCAADEVVNALGHMTGTLRKEIEERFGESGVLVASEVEVANPLRYLNVVESTVATFDPAKIRQRVAAM
jgi:hypothetical protein